MYDIISKIPNWLNPNFQFFEELLIGFGYLIFYFIGITIVSSLLYFIICKLTNTQLNKNLTHSTLYKLIYIILFVPFLIKPFLYLMQENYTNGDILKLATNSVIILIFSSTGIIVMLIRQPYKRHNTLIKITISTIYASIMLLFITPVILNFNIHKNKVITSQKQACLDEISSDIFTFVDVKIHNLSNNNSNLQIFYYCNNHVYILKEFTFKNKYIEYNKEDNPDLTYDITMKYKDDRMNRFFTIKLHRDNDSGIIIAKLFCNHKEYQLSNANDLASIIPSCYFSQLNESTKIEEN